MNKKIKSFRVGRFFLLILCAAGFTACKKNQVEPFTGDDSVYFQLGAAWGDIPDSLKYTFYRQQDKTDLTVNLKISLLGNPVNYDRPVRIELDPEIASEERAAVSGVHFEALPQTVILPADAISVNLPVKFLYSSPMDDHSFVLGISIVDNEYFTLKLPGRDHIVLQISNMAFAPEYWNSSNNTLIIHFGQYSRVKQQVCEQILGVYFPETLEQYYAESSLWAVRGAYMSRWFAANPTLDENGKEILPW